MEELDRDSGPEITEKIKGKTVILCEVTDAGGMNDLFKPPGHGMAKRVVNRRNAA